MAFYIKTRLEVAEYLKVTSERNRTADGNILLWQADVLRFPGDTVLDKAKYAGGVALTASQANQETEGTEYPVAVRLPEWLKPAEEVTVVEGVTETDPETAEESTEEITEVTEAAGENPEESPETEEETAEESVEVTEGGEV